MKRQYEILLSPIPPQLLTTVLLLAGSVLPSAARAATCPDGFPNDCSPSTDAAVCQEVSTGYWTCDVARDAGSGNTALTACTPNSGDDLLVFGTNENGHAFCCAFDDVTLTLVRFYGSPQTDDFNLHCSGISTAFEAPSLVWTYASNDTITLTAGDCQDDDPAVSPAATESCNGQDDDCDGTADEPGSEGGTAFFRDADGDGYGDPAAALVLCGPCSGWVEDASDCVDSDASVHPGVEEVCGNDLDDDCDGSAGHCAMPEHLYDLASAPVRIWGAEEDLHLAFVSGGDDLDGDGQVDLLVGSSDGPGGEAYGGVWLFRGPLAGEYASTDANAVITGAEETERAGLPLMPGDVDGDGIGDLAIGARGAEVGGALWIFHGPVTGTLQTTDAVAGVDGLADGDDLGQDASSAGDQDGDGLDDILVGAPGREDDRGAVYVIRGNRSGTSPASEALAIREGFQERASSGFAVARAGDLDGDGVEDLAIGSPYWDADSSQKDLGVVSVLSGPVLGTGLLVDADATLRGAQPGETLGLALSSVGDTDGDGYDDLIVSAPFYEFSERYDTTGAVYLVPGPIEGDATITTVATATALAADWAWMTGNSLASADMNGDGLLDLLIGATDGSVATSNGAVFLLVSPVSGAIDLNEADAKIYPDHEGACASGVSTAGDMDGDGADDIAIGAPYFNLETEPFDGGAVWVVPGGLGY